MWGFHKTGLLLSLFNICIVLFQTTLEWGRERYVSRPFLVILIVYYDRQNSLQAHVLLFTRKSVKRYFQNKNSGLLTLGCTRQLIHPLGTKDLFCAVHDKVVKYDIIMMIHFSPKNDKNTYFATPPPPVRPRVQQTKQKQKIVVQEH